MTREQLISRLDPIFSRQFAEAMADILLELVGNPADAPTLPAGYVVPPGYEWTGEVRLPRKGEIYLQLSGGVNDAPFDFREEERPILRKIPDVDDVQPSGKPANEIWHYAGRTLGSAICGAQYEQSMHKVENVTCGACLEILRKPAKSRGEEVAEKAICVVPRNRPFMIEWRTDGKPAFSISSHNDLEYANSVQFCLRRHLSALVDAERERVKAERDVK